MTPSRLRWAAVALLGCGAFVAVLARGFGSDPHQVPFMLKGALAPNFAMSTLDGTKVARLEDYRGKPLVINFWATWCEPCLAEHPLFAWASRTYGKDVAFVGVVVEDTEANTRQFLRDNGTTFTQLFDPKSTVAVDFGVTGVPETYFIDRRGIIVSKVAGAVQSREELTASLEMILK